MDYLELMSLDQSASSQSDSQNYIDLGYLYSLMQSSNPCSVDMAHYTLTKYNEWLQLANSERIGLTVSPTPIPITNFVRLSGVYSVSKLIPAENVTLAMLYSCLVYKLMAVWVQVLAYVVRSPNYVMLALTNFEISLNNPSSKNYDHMHYSAIINCQQQLYRFKMPPSILMQCSNHFSKPIQLKSKGGNFSKSKLSSFKYLWYELPHISNRKATYPNTNLMQTVCSVLIALPLNQKLPFVDFTSTSIDYPTSSLSKLYTQFEQLYTTQSPSKCAVWKITAGELSYNDAAIIEWVMEMSKECEQYVNWLESFGLGLDKFNRWEAEKKEKEEKERVNRLLFSYQKEKKSYRKRKESSYSVDGGGAAVSAEKNKIDGYGMLLAGASKLAEVGVYWAQLESTMKEFMKHEQVYYKTQVETPEEKQIKAWGITLEKRMALGLYSTNPINEFDSSSRGYRYQEEGEGEVVKKARFNYTAEVREQEQYVSEFNPDLILNKQQNYFGLLSLPVYDGVAVPKLSLERNGSFSVYRIIARLKKELGLRIVDQRKWDLLSASLMNLYNDYMRVLQGLNRVMVSRALQLMKATPGLWYSEMVVELGEVERKNAWLILGPAGIGKSMLARLLEKLSIDWYKRYQQLYNTKEFANKRFAHFKFTEVIGTADLENNQNDLIEYINHEEQEDAMSGYGVIRLLCFDELDCDFGIMGDYIARFKAWTGDEYGTTKINGKYQEPKTIKIAATLMLSNMLEQQFITSWGTQSEPMLQRVDIINLHSSLSRVKEWFRAEEKALPQWLVQQYLFSVKGKMVVYIKNGMEQKEVGVSATTRTMLGVKKMSEHWIGNVLGLGLVMRQSRVSDYNSRISKAKLLEQEIADMRDDFLADEIKSKRIYLEEFKLGLARRKVEMVYKSLEFLKLDAAVYNSHLGAWSLQVNAMDEETLAMHTLVVEYFWGWVVEFAKKVMWGITQSWDNKSEKREELYNELIGLNGFVFAEQEEEYIEDYLDKVVEEISMRLIEFMDVIEIAHSETHSDVQSEKSGLRGGTEGDNESAVSRKLVERESGRAFMRFVIRLSCLYCEVNQAKGVVMMRLLSYTVEGMLLELAGVGSRVMRYNGYWEQQNLEIDSYLAKSTEGELQVKKAWIEYLNSTVGDDKWPLREFGESEQDKESCQGCKRLLRINKEKLRITTLIDSNCFTNSFANKGVDMLKAIVKWAWAMDKSVLLLLSQLEPDNEQKVRRLLISSPSNKHYPG